MHKLLITNGRVVLSDSIKEGLDIICDKTSGKIESTVPQGEYTSDDTDEVIDAEGNFVSPGFVDIHIHGGGGYDFMDGTVESFLGVSRIHATHGTTSMFPTTLTCTDEELLKVFEVYEEAKKQNTDGAQFLGLHLEGPYFSPLQSGAQDPSYLKKPLPQSYEPLLAASKSIARWSVAPELEGAMEFGDVLTRRGILPSIAHSNAVYETAVEAYKHGYTHATHLYCAMSSIVRKNAYRYAGIIEAAYMLDDMTVEIIADGAHLPKSLLQYVYKFKGPYKTALCTDAIRAAGMPEGEYLLGSMDKGQRVIVEDGVAKLPDRSAFAGSVATTDRLVRTMVHVAEVPMLEAVRMMTQTPARIMHVDDVKGEIAAGKDADIVIFNDNVDVRRTIVGAKTIFSN